ncbi:hypothetical protein EAL2_c11220 [Peptoclostridium acidaminophilum DSM 3953]|uniref:Bacterial Ig-like domain-containing protein n=1 Tax=Peptoclostridium acidaminophilum DSM 3953 TaxID=1286171 RepID=W8T6A5_PEPAC|nr:Ig-like domain-containing protein [Peptoclostridium acidaminophilum]AHM56420.1 hypothetical protein EAL2_c11220 [Peptoclostridium acidaminophilum DSM 3953]
MAVDTIKVLINGTWTTLTKNVSTGKYEGTIAAPNITSYNVNGGHYYPVTVEAKDLAGNVTTKDDTDATLGASCKLYVKEVTKPTISISSPASGAYVINNKQPIVFSLRDEANGSGVKISSLSLKIDSTTFTNTSPGMSITAVSGGYDVTYTPQTALSDGAHTITLNVQDNDGNAATQVSRSYTVDTVPPTLNISNPATDTVYVNNAAFSIAGTTNDATSSPVTVTVKKGGVDQGAVTVNGDGSFSKAITLTEGTNAIVVRATDAAGKYTEVSRTIVLDTVAPVITSITIAPNPVNVGNSYVITVEATD